MMTLAKSELCACGVCSGSLGQFSALIRCLFITIAQ